MLIQVPIPVPDPGPSAFDWLTFSVNAVAALGTFVALAVALVIVLRDHRERRKRERDEEWHQARQVLCWVEGRQWLEPDEPGRSDGPQSVFEVVIRNDSSQSIKRCRVHVTVPSELIEKMAEGDEDRAQKLREGMTFTKLMAPPGEHREALELPFPWASEPLVAMTFTDRNGLSWLCGSEAQLVRLQEPTPDRNESGSRIVRVVRRLNRVFDGRSPPPSHAVSPLARKRAR